MRNELKEASAKRSKPVKGGLIRTYLLRTLVILAIIVGVAVWFVMSMRSSVYDTQLTYMKELAEHDINSIETYLNDNWDSLESTASKLSLQSQLSNKSVAEFLREEKVESGFEDLYFIDENFRAYSASRSWKVDESNIRKYYLTDPRVMTRYDVSEDAVDEGVHYIFSGVRLNGIRVDGHKMIAFVGKCDLNKIQERIRISNYNGQGYSSVFDMDGNMIMGINAGGQNLKNYYDYLSNGTTLKDSELKSIRQKIKAGKSFTANVEDQYSEETSVVSFQPIESQNWYFIISVPRSVFTEQSSRLFLIVGVTMVIVLLAIIWLLVSSMRSRMRIEQREEEERHRRELAVSEDLASQQRHIKAFGDMVNAALWSMDISDENKVVAVHWSNEFRHMFGYEATEEDFPNRLESWSDLLHPEDKERAQKHFDESVQSRDSDEFVYDIEYRIRRKNGEYRWYHAVGRMEPSDNGNRRMYGIVTDISADKKLEEALTQAEIASNAKTAFLFNMSHDIRTPMNAVIGLSDLAEKNLDDREKIGDYIRQIKVSGRQLLSIINNILEVSRIESNKVQIDEYLVDTDELFDGLQTVFMNQARVDKLTINFQKDILHRFLYMDRTHVEEVCINLISNAIKYTPDGGQVDINFSQLPGSNEEESILRIAVKDNGLGMSEEYQSKLFQQFERERTSTVSGIQGTGLGLSIVKRLIDLMEGTIHVKSKLDVGTEMIVELPLRIGEAPEELLAEEAADEVNFEGRRVLLTEDIDVNAMIAEEILRSAGFLVERAKDGQESVNMLDAAPNNYYDLILMDIQMPIMDGYQATEAIRKMENQNKAMIPIIAMTANAFAEDKLKAMAAGMNAHVGKPIEIEMLFDTLKNVLKYRDFLVDSRELNEFKREYEQKGLPCGYFVYKDDEQESIVYADSAVVSTFGCKSEAEFLTHVGRSFRGMVHPEDLEKVESEITTQQTAGSDGVDFVSYRIVRKDGSIRHCKDVGYRAVRGSEHLFYVYIVDVTEEQK